MSENLQIITFQMSKYIYGVDIMNVDTIVDVQPYREVPNSPYYLKGIITIRDEIIPLVSLQERFYLPKTDLSEEEKLLSGYMILKIEDLKIGITIDKISRVLTVNAQDIQKAPEIISGIGHEYIEGIVPDSKGFGNYLVVLNIDKIFNSKDLERIIHVKNDAR